VFYAEFTLNSFDDQERNLTIVKTGFQVLKHKFHACNFKQAFYSLHELEFCVTLTTQKYIFTSFPFGTWLPNLHV